MTATEDELLSHMQHFLAGFKVPKSVEFRDSLPITVDPAPEWAIVARTTATGFAVCCGFALLPLMKIRRGQKGLLVHPLALLLLAVPLLLTSAAPADDGVEFTPDTLGIISSVEPRRTRGMNRRPARPGFLSGRWPTSQGPCCRDSGRAPDAMPSRTRPRSRAAGKSYCVVQRPGSVSKRTS